MGYFPRALFCAAAFSCLVFSSAFAATFDVTRTDDPVPNGCNSGVDCSLREAIIAANANGTDDVINLPANASPYLIQIPNSVGEENAAAEGDLDITENLRIVGAGRDTTVIDGMALSRVFHILGSVTVEISQVTVQNGLSDGGAGGIFIDGGGTVTLDQMRIRGNREDSSSFLGGGGIYCFAGTLHLQNSLVSDNQTMGGGGGLLLESCNAILDADQISGNQAIGGGAIAVDSSPLIIRNSTISGNTATQSDAGGIGTNSPLVLTNSTVSGNKAVGSGGGIGTIDVPIALNNVTITGNIADSDNDGSGDGGGLSVVSGAQVDIRNTIIAGNQGPAGSADCSTPSGTINSQGFNLIGSAAGCTGFSTQANDIINPAGGAGLAALSDNGGPTPTHALMKTSPALDGGRPESNGGCVDESDAPLDFDQRGTGFPRVLAGNPGGAARCDIGAFEASTPDLEVKVTTNSQQVAVGDTITYTITVTNQGPGTATGVVITDQLPNQLAFVSSNTTQGTCNQANGAVSCDLGSLAEGKSVTITIVGKVTAPGNLNNTVGAEQNENDPVPGNSSAIVTTTPSTSGFPLLQGSGCALGQSSTASGASAMLGAALLFLATARRGHAKSRSRTKR